MPRSNARKPSVRVQHKRRQARSDILDAARRVLRERGVDAVTLASVAGELGMTKPALYHYFPSKDALVRALVTTLLDEEIETLIAAVEGDDTGNVLGTLIRAFYDHYIHRLDAFRIVYCHSQLSSAQDLGMDPETIRDEINPRTRHLFDVLEASLTKAGASDAARKEARRLGFTAWTSALGLLTMLSVADATDDPLVHSDSDLLRTLLNVFDAAARGQNYLTS